MFHDDAYTSLDSEYGYSPSPSPVNQPSRWQLLWVVIAVASAFAFTWLLTSFARAEAPQQHGPLGVAPSAAEIELGRKLFFDKQLSANGTVSCATCHDPRRGWSDEQPVAVGILNQRGTRNSPTIINASYSPLMFWDGRTTGQPAQALLPLSNPIEMGLQQTVDVVRRLQLDPKYVALFAEVYGIDQQTRSPITGVNLGRAISAFESTVTSFDAPIDRYLAGDKKAITPDARIGFGIFSRSGCMDCHKPPLFTDNAFHNNGMEFAGKYRVTDQGRIAVLPQQLRVQTPDTVRAFKTPTLREIQRTGPYNHAGNFADLERVVLHYATGGQNYRRERDRFIDPRVKNLGLSDTQRAYLVVFLKEGFASPKYPLIEEPTP